jgi:hypothetical protein
MAERTREDPECSAIARPLLYLRNHAGQWVRDEQPLKERAPRLTLG